MLRPRTHSRARTAALGSSGCQRSNRRTFHPPSVPAASARALRDALPRATRAPLRSKDSAAHSRHRRRTPRTRPASRSAARWRTVRPRRRARTSRCRTRSVARPPRASLPSATYRPARWHRLIAKRVARRGGTRRWRRKPERLQSSSASLRHACPRGRARARRNSARRRSRERVRPACRRASQPDTRGCRPIQAAAGPSACRAAPGSNRTSRSASRRREGVRAPRGSSLR